MPHKFEASSGCFRAVVKYKQINIQ